MIVWSGRGFLLILVFIAAMVLFINILPKEQNDYAFVLAAYVTGAFSWIFGIKWNKQQNERIFTDEKTG